jgi:hypothetical protein
MISVLVFGRNDEHGYNLPLRACISINCVAEMLQSSDEIVFCDYATEEGRVSFPECVSTSLTKRSRDLLTVVKVPVEVHRRRFGRRTSASIIPAVAYNVALRRSNPNNRWVLITTTDMVFAPRNPGETLSSIGSMLADGFYSIPRYEMPEYLWETLDPRDPLAAIDKFRQWGQTFHLEEDVDTELPDLYDAPGDFMLVLRDELLAIGGFDEGMILGPIGPDSNLSQRLSFIGRRVTSLADRLAGYHCDHTRGHSASHSANRLQNDFTVFVRSLSQAQLPWQAERWGLAGEPIEETRVNNDTPRRRCVELGDFSRGKRLAAATEKILAVVPSRRLQASLTHAAFNVATYPSEHVLPFLAERLSMFPEETRIGYIGANAVLASYLAQVVAATFNSRQLWGYEGLLPPSDILRLVPLHAIYRQCDVLVFDFGFDDRSFSGKPKIETLPKHERQSLYAVLSAFEKVVEWERANGLRRDIIAVNAINTCAEPIVNGALLLNLTPFSTRVRHGRVRTKPVTYAVNAAEAEYLAAVLGRHAGIPAWELSHAKSVVRRLLDAGPQLSIPKQWAMPAVVAALQWPPLAKIEGVTQAYIDALVERVEAARSSNRILERLSDGLLGLFSRPYAPGHCKIADVDDWENPEWLQHAAIVSPPDGAYPFQHRNRFVWERAQLLYALHQRGLLNRGSRVAVVAAGSDDLPVILTDLVGMVHLIDGRPDPDARERDQGREHHRWLDRPRLFDFNRISVCGSGIDSLMAGDCQYDAILFIQNIIFGGGLGNFVRAFRWAERALKANGLIGVAFDASIDAKRSINCPTAVALGDGRVENAFVQGSALRLTAPFNLRMRKETFDLFADVDASDGGPHLVFQLGGDLRTSVTFTLEHAGLTGQPSDWNDVAFNVMYADCDLLSAMSLTERGERKNGVVYSRPEAGSGWFLYGPYLSLVEGNYEVQIDVAIARLVDGIVMSVEVGRGPLRIVGPELVTSKALSVGQGVRVGFSVSADDAGPFEIRIASMGRGRLGVAAVRIRRSAQAAAIRSNTIWRLMVAIRRAARRLPWLRRLVRRARRAERRA